MCCGISSLHFGGLGFHFSSVMFLVLLFLIWCSPRQQDNKAHWLVTDGMAFLTTELSTSAVSGGMFLLLGTISGPFAFTIS